MLSETLLGVLPLPVSSNSTVKLKACEDVVHVPLLQVLVMAVSVIGVAAVAVKVSVPAPLVKVVQGAEVFALGVIPINPEGIEALPVSTHHS